MKPFRFRLATLLRLREAARDRRRAHLAQAYEADDVLRGRMGELADEVVEVDRHSRQAAVAGPIEADALVVAQRYKMILQAERKLLGGQSETVAEEIERRREVLVAADRDVKVLEKLREKHRERHQKEENRQEVNLLDEVAGRMALDGITDSREEMI
ncbi:MAG: flagellar export protein FliJ [Planctomycetes bacterium]|nr:flagellar export protein FliJ [Planctomycetota bacterium]